MSAELQFIRCAVCIARPSHFFRMTAHKVVARVDGLHQRACQQDNLIQAEGASFKSLIESAWVMPGRRFSANSSSLLMVSS